VEAELVVEVEAVGAVVFSAVGTAAAFLLLCFFNSRAACFSFISLIVAAERVIQMEYALQR
jgi:hypothetical protein